eukprot:616666-Amphidinium_carterae.2
MPCPRYSGKTANGDIFGLSSLLMVAPRVPWLPESKQSEVYLFAVTSLRFLKFISPGDWWVTGRQEEMLGK